jgi:hypothetical protein
MIHIILVDVSSLTQSSNFMEGKSTDNYPESQLDNILNSWSSSFFWSSNPNVFINFGDINWTFAGGLSGYITLTESPYF